ncbi:hypothetical protein FGG08_001261 [Glutinoglossum americanum]|uniref:Nitrogen regulatory protein areA GATA-like domain-containing protein n=1 Tax=Glutinoglossum americanum TaxID=1670608 RepID=A0A9P8IF40_9PEZI|nr:hypothetical protein FGG08_001261 [Glutinoglossum americanum]
MTTNLPKGFVTNSESIPGDIERIGTVDVEEIFQLWRVYTTNKNVLQNDVGLRLENLFWRIWSNDQIRGNIKGSTVAKLFILISGAQTSKQNTLVKSPHSPRGLSEVRSVREARDPLTPSSRLLSPLQKNPPPHLVQSYSPLGSQASREALSTPPEHQPPSPSIERPKAVLPPPILKRPRGNTMDSSTQAATLAVQEESGSSICSAVDTVLRPPTPPKSRKDPTGGLKRKRTSFVASTAASTRRKPTLAKRKLSQSSVANQASSLTLPLIPPSGQNGRGTGSRELTATQTTFIPESRTRGSHLPPLGDKIGVDPKNGRIQPQSVDTPRRVRNEQKLRVPVSAEHGNLGGGKPNLATSVDGEDPRIDWLVERDFRSKFVDKKRQERFAFLLRHPSTSKTGPTLAQSSMEATATIESGENSTTKVLTKGKKMFVVDGVVPLKTEGFPQHQLLEDNGGPLAPLPRTKSQLTFLLERDRAAKAQEKQKNRKSSS